MSKEKDTTKNDSSTTDTTTSQTKPDPAPASDVPEKITPPSGITADADTKKATTATETTSLLHDTKSEEKQKEKDNNKKKKTTRKDSDEEHGVGGDDDVDDMPERSCLFKIFRTISILSSITSILMFVSQLVSLLILQNAWIQYVLRAYVMIICCMFVLAECRFKWITRRIPSFLGNWFGRGFLYSFVGVIGMEESFATIGKAYPDVPHTGLLFQAALLKIGSTTMFGLGVIYMAMGLLCLKGVYEHAQEEYHHAVEEVHERQRGARN